MYLEPLDDGGIRVLAPAKINLYLDILGLRPDGYHEIDTLMQVVSLFDELRFRPRRDCCSASNGRPPPNGCAPCWRDILVAGSSRV